MSEITPNTGDRSIVRVGADLAKRVIQVHAVDAVGKLVTNRSLPRDKFIEWCAQLPVRCLHAGYTLLAAMKRNSGIRCRRRKVSSSPKFARTGRDSRTLSTLKPEAWSARK